MRESGADKASRLLADHRVFIRLAVPELVRAAVRGDSSVYDVDLRQGRWSCTCPVRSGDCSHLVAVMAVTVPDSVHV